MNQSLKPPTDSAQQVQRSSPQLEDWWVSLPDAIVVWDRTGKILSLNAAACTLFEISASDDVVGASIQPFFQRYTWSDEQYHPFSFAPWLLDLTTHQNKAASRSYKQTLVLGLPSTRTVLLELRCAPMLDAQGQPGGMLAIFQKVTPRYQKALHLQRVSEALTVFNEAIAQLPEQFLVTFSEENLLLSPPVLFMDQQLVAVIHEVLASWRVTLLLLCSSSGRLSYVVGSGFTVEQEQQRRNLTEHWLLSDYADETMLARLRADQEVILTTDCLRGTAKRLIGMEAATLLGIPLFLRKKLVGVLLIHKQGLDREYTQEEIDLVRVVAVQARLLVEYLSSLRKQVGNQARELILSEVSRLSNGFLILASHELRTPLTGIKGHL